MRFSTGGFIEIRPMGGDSGESLVTMVLEKTQSNVRIRGSPGEPLRFSLLASGAPLCTCHRLPPPRPRSAFERPAPCGLPFFSQGWQRTFTGRPRAFQHALLAGYVAGLRDFVVRPSRAFPEPPSPAHSAQKVRREPAARALTAAAAVSSFLLVSHPLLPQNQLSEDGMNRISDWVAAKEKGLEATAAARLYRGDGGHWGDEEEEDGAGPSFRPPERCFPWVIHLCAFPFSFLVGLGSLRACGRLHA